MARFVSLLLASTLALSLLFLPAMRGGAMTPAGHALLTPLMLAICFGFVHGVGYRPRRQWLRALLHPTLLWPAMLGLALAWVNSY